MQVLSVQQPFASLIARGFKHYERRSWAATFHGRIAIHASKQPPSFSLLADARRDVRMWRHFKREGWHDREALLALPRSAIVGTVELVRIVRPGDLDFIPDLVGEPDDSEYLWEFADACAIEPVAVARGWQKLWTLDDVAAQAVADAESRARAAGGNPPVPVPETAEFARTPSWRDANEAFWKRMRESLDVLPSAERGPSSKRSPFRDPAFDSLVRRVVDGYYATHRRREGVSGAEVAIDRRRAELCTMFGNRQWVKCSEFEEKLRLELRNAGASTARLQKIRAEAEGVPFDDWGAIEEFRHLDRFVESLDSPGIAHPLLDPREDFPRHGGGRPEENIEEG